MNITIPDLTGAECGDIAITAAEGGIGHWAQIFVYDHKRWSSGEDTPYENANVDDDFVFYTIRFENPTGPGEIESEITPKLLKRGFEKALAAPLDRGGWMANGLLTVSREDWTGEIDSVGADMLVQFGIFGEVVFS